MTTNGTANGKTDTPVSNPMTFTAKDGSSVVMEPIQVPYSLLTSLYRIQEDYETRGEYLSMRGVLENAITDGIAYRRNVWTQGDKSRILRTVDKKYDSKLSEIADNPSKFQPEDVFALLKQRAEEKAAVRRTKR